MSIDVERIKKTLSTLKHSLTEDKRHVNSFLTFAISLSGHLIFSFTYSRSVWQIYSFCNMMGILKELFEAQGCVSPCLIISYFDKQRRTGYLMS